MPMKGQPPKGGQSASWSMMHREGIRKSIHGKACAMQSTNTYLGLLRERGKRGLPLTRVYRQLFNKQLYLTAYGKIYHTWGSATWIIEGDISDCFGSLSHELILSALSEKIHDGRFLHLMKKLLDAGYLEDWKYHRTLSGVPQGSIVSPILSNILLDKLDTFVETVLIPQYTRGEKRKLNQEYVKLHRQMHKLLR